MQKIIYCTYTFKQVISDIINLKKKKYYQKKNIRKNETINKHVKKKFCDHKIIQK